MNLVLINETFETLPLIWDGSCEVSSSDLKLPEKRQNIPIGQKLNCSTFNSMFSHSCCSLAVIKGKEVRLYLACACYDDVEAEVCDAAAYG
jgi:hypothetical protein